MASFFSIPLSRAILNSAAKCIMQLRTKTRRARVQISEFRSFSWPVKIRVRADKPLMAPRQPPVFPASLSDLLPIEPVLLVRTIELPNARPCRRAPGTLAWQPGVAETGKRENDVTHPAPAI
jgi:hypothetical protein